MRLVYSLLFTLLVPLLTLRLLWRSRRAPDYRRRLGERLGFFRLPEDSRPTLWVHAVSLGETLAARPLIERLLEARPDYRVLVTTTTPTGSAQVRRLFGDRVAHVYAPWDTPGAVRRFLRRARPRVLVLMETELWPNMLHYSATKGCRIVLANARLSARSAAGYARFAKTTRRMLKQLHWIAAQGTADADRFMQLGMDPSRIAVSGSIKFDVSLSDDTRRAAEQMRDAWQMQRRPGFIMASTHPGEDELALRVYTRLRTRHPGLLLLLVPRHPERFGSVHRLASDAGYRVQTRSSGQIVAPQTEVLLVDTLGELLLMFGTVDVAVIGGSFIEHGGHNPLEAAVWGKPVICGPSMFNFAQVTEGLVDEGALVQIGAHGRASDSGNVDMAGELETELSRLLADPQERQRRGAAALRVIDANRGAIDALEEAVLGLLDDR